LIITNPHFWTDVLVHDDVSVSVIELQLQRTGLILPLRLWITSAGSLKTNTFIPSLAAQVKLADVEKWIGMPLPNLRDLHLGGLTVNGHPHTIRIFLPKLEKLSFGLTVPRFFFPESQLRYLGFVNSLVTMDKLSQYMMHCQGTLETLYLDDVTVTDMDAPGAGFPLLVMPRVEEVVIQTPGGDGFASLLLTNVHYPELRSLTFGASSGKKFGSWNPLTQGDINLPNLEILDFDGGRMPTGAFRDVLESTANIRKLVMPRFGSEEQLSAAVDALVAWSHREGKRLEELAVVDLNAKDMVRIIQALPSVRTLDMSRTSKKREPAGDSEEWLWLQEHVDNLVEEEG
ncbi:hypothetical protein FRC01_004492, partial [Tulasnella sp. 417]